MAQIQEIRIMFDTNAMFTGTSHKLVNDKVRGYISANVDRVDLSLKFYIPSVVVEERRYQMINKGLELLMPVGKLELLLGHQLGINEEILKSRVADAITKEMAANKLTQYIVDCNKVDWANAITLSTGRKPPFEKGEKEKGFKDFIIANTFFQLCKESPITPKHCRLIFITNDTILAEYIELNCSERQNVKVLDSVESLNSYIETMASTMGEELLKEIQEKVSKMFWDFETKTGLLVDWKIQEKIQFDFKKQLSELPLGASTLKIESFSIYLPRFEKKEKHIIHWVSVFCVKMSAFTFDVSGNQPSSVASLGSSAATLTNQQATLMSSFLNKFEKKIFEGEITFDIKWQVTLTTTKILKAAKLEGLSFKEAKWTPVEK